MPSSMTKLNVWNLAIDIIKDTALQSTQQDAATARWLDRNWQHTVETTMRQYNWSFAKEQFLLSAEAERPLFGWTYYYGLPAGWLRVLPIVRGGHRFGAIVPHEIIGNRIATNEPPALPVTLIMDRSNNPGLWDSLFVEVVRCKLALGMANKFTSKARYIPLAQEMLAAATQLAEQIDAFEGGAEPNEEFDILRYRNAGLEYIPPR